MPAQRSISPSLLFVMSKDTLEARRRPRRDGAMYPCTFPSPGEPSRFSLVLALITFQIVPLLKQRLFEAPQSPHRAHSEI